MAAKQNFTIEQGATFKKRLTWRDKNKRAINLTGYVAILQIRATADAPSVLLELSTANGAIVITPTKGQIDIEIAHTTTLALTFQQGVYDLLLIAPDGDHIRLLEGRITVSPGVTRQS